MSELTAGRRFYDEQIAALETHDIDRLLAQYHDDAVLIGFDFIIQGRQALRDHFVAYLARLGSLNLVSTDRFTETEDSIFFEATILTSLAEAKVYDVFMLRDGKTTHQFTGVISVSPLTFPT
jgi:hypothetical protein